MYRLASCDADYPQGDSNPCLQDENPGTVDCKSLDDKTCGSGQPDSAENSASWEALPADLAAIAAPWPLLPEHIRQAILTLVDSVRDGERAR